MPFVENILKYESVAFVGMGKNCGKTEVMNYFLRKVSLFNRQIAVTSIGIDGEQSDQVTNTAKPEIILKEGDIFLTCEPFYCKRELVSEILDFSSDSTALGRLVTARVLSGGKVMLAGPSDTVNLKRHISRLKGIGADMVVVDGALSRISIASPTVTDSLVLSTGAVVAPSIDEIVRKTAYQVQLIRLPEYDSPWKKQFNEIGRGIYNITNHGLVDTGIDSIFAILGNKGHLFKNGKRIFFSGVLNDAVLEFFILQPFCGEIEVVVRDFTKIFVSKRVLSIFQKRGGRVFVVNSSKLLAVCVNPTSVSGYILNSRELCDAMEQEISQNVYDVREL